MTGSPETKRDENVRRSDAAQTPSSARVVIVDDDPLFLESLEEFLKTAAFAVTPFNSGQAALDYLLKPSGDDILLLDWKMPEMNGIEVLRRLRSAGLQMPVILLTGLTEQIYEEAALQGGAIDFVEKSRGFSILLKRMQLILLGIKARTGKSAGATGSALAGAVMHRGPLELHKDASRAFWNGSELSLTVTEYKMVELLVERAGQFIRFRELYDVVHGEGFVAGYGDKGFRTNLRGFIKRIRQKFREIDKNFDAIETYARFGYRWHDNEG